MQHGYKVDMNLDRNLCKQELLCEQGLAMQNIFT